MSWHCKTIGAYIRSSDEAKENARMIWGIKRRVRRVGKYWC